MSDYALERNHNPGNPLPVLMLMALLGFGILAAIVLSQHATEKHGVSADIVRQCMNSNGPIEIWINPTTGREANICKIGEKFGVQIVDGNREITAFIKEKMKTLSQVQRYLTNSGYFLK